MSRLGTSLARRAGRRRVGDGWGHGPPAKMAPPPTSRFPSIDAGSAPVTMWLHRALQFETRRRCQNAPCRAVPILLLAARAAARLLSARPSGRAGSRLLDADRLRQ